MPRINPKNKKPKIPLKRKGGKRMKMPKKPGFWTNLLTTIVIFLLLLSVYGAVFNEERDFEEISLSTLARDIKEGSVSSLVVEGEDIEAEYNDGSFKKTKKESGTALSETLSNYGVALGEVQGLDVEIKSPSGLVFWLLNIAPFALPILFILFFIWYLSRQVKGQGMQAFSFGQSKARFIDPKDKGQKITFKDVAGVKEAKEELKEIVEFLRNPKKFLNIGAEIPKGVILMGEPGTGKTLLARAVAGEASVPFFSISGSEFVEMFVGVGASRVRDLFKLAKKSAPAIIFIDEIDAVGRVRGTGYGGGNDEREQTLNQVLVEMDGFEPHEKVIVLAATNRPDVLDQALLRPGRFDRRVKLDLPDRDDREKILEIHIKSKPLAEDVDLRVIAERTPGLSGADLQSIMNEAAILAAKENRTKVSQYDLIRSIEKVMLGPERKSHILSDEEKKIAAYHEAGHALVSSVLEHADPVHKVSIISRGHAAGYTLNLPLEEKKLKSKKDFLDTIAMVLGGYVTEQKIFGDITTGPSNDLKAATSLARDMVTKYGMSEEIGPIALESSKGKALFGKGIEGEEYSEKVSALIDSEISKIINKGKKKALDVIKKHDKLLDAITAALIDKETLEQKQFEQILISHGVELKKDRDNQNKS